MNKNDPDKLFHIYKQEVIRHDPVGLVDGGAPEDEYDSEIWQLVRATLDIEEEEHEYEKLIQKIFGSIGQVQTEKCGDLARALIQKRKHMNEVSS